MKLPAWRRLGAVTAGAALVGALTAGAAPAKTDGSARVQATTTITLAHWNSSPVELAALRATIKRFERSFRTIKVREITIDPYPEGMLARFAARRPPDIFYVDSNPFQDWVAQGVLEPISDDIARAKISTKPFYPRLLGAFRYKGKLYGLPKDWSPLATQVNTAALSRANVRAPQTWAQLRAAGQALRSAGQPPICLGVDLARILAFMYQNNGSFLNANKTRAVVNSSANTGAVATYLGWIQSGIARTPQQLGMSWCGEALGKEKASIIFEGNWVTGFMKDTYPNVRYQTVPMVRNRARGNLAFTVSYSIAKDSKHKAEAFRLLRFLTGPVGMRIWAQQSGFLPARSDVKPPAGRAVFLREAPYARPWQFAPGFSKVYDTANNELQAAFEGKQSIPTALQKIQDAATDALRKRR